MPMMFMFLAVVLLLLANTCVLSYNCCKVRSKTVAKYTFVAGSEAESGAESVAA